MQRSKATKFAILAGVGLWATTLSGSAYALTYTLTDLGVPAGSQSFAYGINNAGQVVGDTFVTVSSGGATSAYATLWSGGTVSNLGGLPGSVGGVAFANNDLGQAVGDSSTSDGTTYATLWRRGSATDLGILSGFTESVALGINNAGRVVGYSFNRTGSDAATMWSGGSIIDLGGLPGRTGSLAFAINNAGQVVGASQFGNGSNYESRATLWSRGSATDLGVLPGDTGSVALAINNSGDAVGYSVTNGVVDNATLWSRGVITGLGALPGSITTVANAVNDAGQIVGQCLNLNTNTWDATLWSDGSIIDLNSVDAASGWHLQDATAINNRGQIAGYGINPLRQFHAFLLTPVSEPPTISGAATKR